MNLRVKFRESFRRFAPSTFIEDVPEYFERDRESPYMLLVANVRKDKLCERTAGQKRAMKDPDFRRRVNVKRSVILAVTHIMHHIARRRMESSRPAQRERPASSFSPLHLS